MLLQLFWRSKCSAALQRQLIDIVFGIGNQKKSSEFVKLVYDLYRENYFKQFKFYSSWEGCENMRQEKLTPIGGVMDEFIPLRWSWTDAL